MLTLQVKEAARSIFQVEIPSLEFQPTRKDFEGDITIVVFPMLRFIKGNPEQIGKQLGDFLVNSVPEVSHYNTVKGFLNIVLGDASI